MRRGVWRATLAAVGALSVVGVDANPDAHEHARLRYTAPGLSFERGLAESWGEPYSYDLITFLQTIEHIHDPEAMLAHLRSLLAPWGAAYISTPNLLTLAPAGAEKSDNPWHIREYRAHEFRELCESAFGSVQLFGLYHARKLAVHERALQLGWDRVHKGLRISRPFYDRFTPAISARDFVLSDIRPMGEALDFVAVCR